MRLGRRCSNRMTEGERTGPSQEAAKQSDSDRSSTPQSTDKRDKLGTQNMLPKELVESLNRGRKLIATESNDTTIRELHSKLDAVDCILSDLSFPDMQNAKPNPVSGLIGKMQQMLTQKTIKKPALATVVDGTMNIKTAGGLKVKDLNLNINFNLRLTTENRTPSRSPLREKYSLPKSVLQSAVKATHPHGQPKKFDSLKLITDLKEKFKKKPAPDTTGLSIDKRSTNEDIKKKSLGQLQNNLSKPKELSGNWTSRNLNCFVPNCSRVADS